MNVWGEGIRPAARALAKAFWPGPLTLILNKQPWVSPVITGGRDTIGLRVPDHPLTLQVLSRFTQARLPAAAGIVAPSANRSGGVSPTTAAHVLDELGKTGIRVLDGGACALGIESTIVDCSSDVAKILRVGAISAEDVARIAGEVLGPEALASDGPRYSPRTPIEVVPPEAFSGVVNRYLNAGRRLAVLALSAPAPAQAGQGVHWRTAPDDAARYAREFYANLRALDALQLDLILVEAPPSGPEWLVVGDRLKRAGSSTT